MKTKTFTSEEVGRWLATFHKLERVDEYRHSVHVLRCVFEASEDEDFWNEVCEAASKELKK